MLVRPWLCHLHSSKQRWICLICKRMSSRRNESDGRYQNSPAPSLPRPAAPPDHDENPSIAQPAAHDSPRTLHLHHTLLDLPERRILVRNVRYYMACSSRWPGLLFLSRTEAVKGEGAHPFSLVIPRHVFCTEQHIQFFPVDPAR